MDNTKTDLLQEIKYEIAHKWFKEHRPIVSEWNFDQIPYESQIGLWPEVCKRYAFEVAKASLKEAKNNITFTIQKHQIEANKQYYLDLSAIIDESNIKL